MHEKACRSLEYRAQTRNLRRLQLNVDVCRGRGRTFFIKGQVSLKSYYWLIRHVIHEIVTFADPLNSLDVGFRECFEFCTERKMVAINIIT